MTSTVAMQIRKVLTLAISASKNDKVAPALLLRDLHEAGLELPVHDSIDVFVDQPGERCESLKSLATQVVDSQAIHEIVQNLCDDFDNSVTARHLISGTAEYASLAAQSVDALESWLQQQVASGATHGVSPVSKETPPAKDVTDRIKLLNALNDRCPRLDTSRLGESLIDFLDYLHRLGLSKTDICIQSDSLLRTFVTGVDELSRATSGLSLEPIATQLAKVIAGKPTLFDLSVGRAYCEQIPKGRDIGQSTSANELFEQVNQFKKRVDGWYVLRELLV